MPRILTLTVATALVLSGCASGERSAPPSPTEAPGVGEPASAAPEDPWEDTPEQQFFRDMAFNAEVEGSGQAQIDLLIEAGKSGVLEPQRVEELLPPFFECLADAGATGVQLPDAEVAPGLTYVDYRIDYSAEGGEELAVQERAVIDCELEHFAFAWQAIHRQPAVP